MAVTAAAGMIEPGKLVIVKAPNFIKGEKLGFVIKACKDHDNSWVVQVLDPNVTTRVICVGISPKDTIRLG